MNGRNKFFIAALIGATIGLGFLRDYIFVSINEEAGQGPSGTGNLFIWKWPLTVGFALIYMGATCMFLHLLFFKKIYILLAVYIYFFLLATAFLAAAGGYIVSSFAQVYPFVRTVMGIAQSPIPIIVLIPACVLNEHLMVNK